MKKILLILFLASFFGLKSQVVNQMTLYPNPATTYVNISFTEPIKTDITVVISDILGNKIETLKYSAGTAINIDLATLSLTKGLYLIKVEAGDQNFIKRLVVKS
jgi:hypothetical protein